MIFHDKNSATISKNMYSIDNFSFIRNLLVSMYYQKLSLTHTKYSKSQCISYFIRETVPLTIWVSEIFDILEVCI